MLQSTYEGHVFQLAGRKNIPAAIYISEFIVGGVFALLESWMAQGMNRSVHEMAELSVLLPSHHGIETAIKSLSLFEELD